MLATFDLFLTNCLFNNPSTVVFWYLYNSCLALMKNTGFVAECFKDRTDVQCLHRWQKVLNPELVKGPWSKEVIINFPFYPFSRRTFFLYNYHDYHFYPVNSPGVSIT